MDSNLHFTSGGGRIRPVVNLRVPEGTTPLASPFPLAPAPLRGGGVEVEVSVSTPFIVVGERLETVGNFRWTTKLSWRRVTGQGRDTQMFGAFRPTVAVSVGLLWY